MRIHQYIVAISIIDNKLFILRDKVSGLWHCPIIDATESRQEIRLIHYIRRRVGTDLKIEGRIGDVEILGKKVTNIYSLFDVRFLGGINLNDEDIDLWAYKNRFELETMDLDQDLKSHIVPYLKDKRILL